MNKFLIFAGTTEGRKLTEYLSGQSAFVYACTATPYGEELLPERDNLKVIAKRMDCSDILALLQQENFSLVIDATHPYAEEVSLNIRKACEISRIPHIRIIRESADCGTGGAVIMPSIDKAVEYLAKRPGNIFVSTGSKDLKQYASLPDYKNRLYVRVLPDADAVNACHFIGLKGKHIICMQGPFSEQLNTALLKECSASYLVTKESGEPGGFSSKIAAAVNAGVTPVVIKRPEERDGLTLNEAFDYLSLHFSCSPPESSCPKTLYLIGSGPGSSEFYTKKALDCLQRADVIFGSKRLLNPDIIPQRPCFPCYIPEDINTVLKEHPEFATAAVLFSGDISFYSGAAKAKTYFEERGVNVVPVAGISSLSYFSSVLGRNLEDACFLSLHGKTAPVISTVFSHQKTFLLTDGKDGPEQICQSLLESGLDHVTVSVGERLSYKDEKITSGTPGELLGKSFSPLNAVFILNPFASCPDTVPGLPDSAFIRGNVPMTKSEIRAVSISKLRPAPDSIVWDIGAGTGSVTVELARAAYNGSVYAIERKDEALSLISANKKAFHLDNIQIIPGTAPDVLTELPAPTHVFIGGSSGNLRTIIDAVFYKNPAASIVVNAVTLETLSAVVNMDKEFYSVSALMVHASGAEEVRDFHILKSGNPVFIFTIRKKRGEAQ